VDGKQTKRRRELSAKLRSAQATLHRERVGYDDGALPPHQRAGGAWIVGNAADALDGCCTRAVGFSLCDHAPEKNASTRARCRHRLCPYCHAIRSVSVGAALEVIVQDEFKAGAKLGVVTLTMKHTKADKLRFLRDKLSAAWARFVRSGPIRALIVNYHRVAEVERTIANGWHPHFHVLVSHAFDKAQVRKAHADGTLSKLPWVRAVERWRLAKAKAVRGKRFSLKLWREAAPARLAEYAGWALRDLGDFILSVWSSCCAKEGRESVNNRFRPILPSKQPGKVVQVRFVKGRYVRKVRDLSVVLKELTKYVTKGSAAGQKGKLGLMQYSPAELLEYTRGIRGWRMHQSTKAWAAAEKAAEIEDIELCAQASHDDGGRMVSWVQLVDGGQRAVAGISDAAQVGMWLADAAACLTVLERESAGGPICPEQYSALSDAVSYVATGGGPRPDFNLTWPEKLELAKLRGWMPGAAGARLTLAETYALAEALGFKWHPKQGESFSTAMVDWWLARDGKDFGDAAGALVDAIAEREGSTEGGAACGRVSNAPLAPLLGFS